MKEQCELYDRECINCGECEICDLDPKKHCDNCGCCIDEVDEYRSVTIDDFINQNVSKEEIERISKELSEAELEENDENDNFEDNKYSEDDEYSEENEEIEDNEI